MIRSIAFELFDRLTTDPGALRKQVAEARADRDAVEAELLDYKCGTRAHAANATAKELAQLTAERDALQLQVNELKLQLESSPTTIQHTKQVAALAVAQFQISYLQGTIAEYRDRMQSIVDEQLGRQETLGFADLLTCVENGLRKVSRVEAQLLLQHDKTDLTIEPTWILAAWSVSGSEWSEVKRGSYDAMLADMRRDATSWNLFSRSNWDALVKNGGAR